MPSKLNLDYYYGSEAEQYSFYRVPKTLFTDARYKGVSIEAKVLYGLLLDRMGLSIKNGWLDSDGRVYIYFTQEDAMGMMDCGHNKAVKLFADLEQTGLIERRKQGQGRPTRIYVKNFVLPPLPDQTAEPEPPQPPADGQTSDFGKSDCSAPPAGEVLTSDSGKSALPETGSPDFPKRDANNTEKKKTEWSDTEPSIFPPAPTARDRPPTDRSKRRMRMDEIESYRALIRENIEYDLLLQDHPYDEETLEGYLELMVEVCCSRREYIRIGGNEVPTAVVKSRFLKLNREHIRYVLSCMNTNTTLIRNIKAYTLAALYNAPTTISQFYASQVSHDMAQGWENE